MFYSRITATKIKTKPKNVKDLCYSNHGFNFNNILKFSKGIKIQGEYTRALLADVFKYLNNLLSSGKIYFTIASFICSEINKVGISSI